MTMRKSVPAASVAEANWLESLNRVVEVIAGGNKSINAEAGARLDSSSESVPATQFHNWPKRQRNDFFGRHAAVIEVLKSLSQSRAVAIVGMGGWGKTSLAVAAADCIAGRPPAGLSLLGAEPALAELRGCCADAIYYVDMTQCSQDSEDDIWGEIGNQLGLFVRADGHASVASRVQETYKRAFASRKALLVLDSAEHQQNADALANIIVQLAAQAKVLLTSRVPVAGAQSIEIKAMAKPNLRSAPATWLANEAVQLFAHRVALDLHPLLPQSAPQQALARQEDVIRELLAQDANVAQIVRLCCKLECIPLALVLAASRASDYVARADGSPAQWLQAMRKDLEKSLLEPLEMQEDDRQREPTDERHQTMEKCILWSYNLLDANSQSLLRSLSIFRASWTLEDMQKVCAGAEEAHQNLWKAHLIVREESSAPATYTLYDTIREFADRMLTAKTSPEARTQLENRYVDRYVTELRQHLSEENAEARLQKELPDIQKALEIAAARNPPAFKTAQEQLTQQWEKAWKRNDTPALDRYFPIMENLLDLMQAQNLVLKKRSPLHYLQRGRDVNKVLANDLQLNALFGAKNPDYTQLHELETKAWLEEAKLTILVLVNRAREDADQKTLSLVFFMCMYFITHDWWDAYFQDTGAIGRKLLAHWSRAAQTVDRDLLPLLKMFDESYPPKSQWEQRVRPESRRQWQKAYEALNAIQKMLLPQTLGDNFVMASLSQPEQFLYGILMRYLGEADFYAHQHSSVLPARKDWEKHYAHSLAALKPEGKQQNDSYFRFVWQWSLGDAAQRYEQMGNTRDAAMLCEQLIADEYEECAGDETRLDSELLANAYATLGGVAMRQSRFDEAALCHSAAVLLAYIYLLTERDSYAITFYNEHRARMEARAHPLFHPTPSDLLLLTLRSHRPIRAGALRAAYEQLYRFWKPYWELNPEAQHPAASLPASIAHLLQSVSLMMPDPPGEEAALNQIPSPYLERIAAVLQNMAASEEWAGVVRNAAGRSAAGQEAQESPMARMADFIDWLNNASPGLMEQAYTAIRNEQEDPTEPGDSEAGGAEA